MNTYAKPELQPLRKRIFHGILLIFGLFGVFGFILIVSVFLATRTSPKMIHQNYDSIEAASKMSQAWNARIHPEHFAKRSDGEWVSQFENALLFSKANITEPGEEKLVREIEKIWTAANRDQLGILPAETTQRVNQLLAELVIINERGLFQLAAEAQDFGKQVLLGSLVFLALLILISIAVSNQMAGVLSEPLKKISEVLGSHPKPGEQLDLPEPTSSEIQLLSQELLALWHRVSETDRLKLEQILAQRNELQTVLASVEDAVLVVDRDGHILHHNEKILKLLGATSQQILGRCWRDLPDSLANCRRLKTLFSPEISENKVTDFNVGEKTVSYCARHRSITAIDGVTLGTVFLLRDVTEQKHRERLKAEFMGVLSHELKTPLQSLSTASDLLIARRELFQADVQLLVETIQEDVSRIRGVANDFVQMSQLEQPSLRLKMEATDLTLELPQWIKPFQVIAKEKEIRLNYSREGSPELLAKIDRVKFPWVLSNLLSNAIRVSPPQSRIEILLTDRNGGIEVKVTDEGPGISPEIQSSMYEPFYPGTGGRKPPNAGFLGIGLTIVKEVVEAHDGKVEYHPTPPKGSAFRVILPFAGSA